MKWQCNHRENQVNAYTLYRKFKTYIPRNETARRRSQFLQVSESDLYIPTIGPRRTDPGKLGDMHYNSVWEVMRPRSFISGNT
jgi:hypothetical protein